MIKPMQLITSTLFMHTIIITIIIILGRCDHILRRISTKSQSRVIKKEEERVVGHGTRTRSLIERRGWPNIRYIPWKEKLRHLSKMVIVGSKILVLESFMASRHVTN